MTDFWRLINALIVVVIVLLALFWRRKRTKGKTVDYGSAATPPERLSALKARKHKLACELEGYADDIACLETESRQMVDAYLAEHEARVTRLVREESRALLDEMQAAADAALKADADAVKADFARRLDEEDN